MVTQLDEVSVRVSKTRTNILLIQDRTKCMDTRGPDASHGVSSERFKGTSGPSSMHSVQSATSTLEKCDSDLVFSVCFCIFVATADLVVTTMLIYRP